MEESRRSQRYLATRSTVQWLENAQRHGNMQWRIQLTEKDWKSRTLLCKSVSRNNFTCKSVWPCTRLTILAPFLFRQWPHPSPVSARGTQQHNASPQSITVRETHIIAMKYTTCSSSVQMINQSSWLTKPNRFTVAIRSLQYNELRRKSRVRPNTSGSVAVTMSVRGSTFRRFISRSRYRQTTARIIHGLGKPISSRCRTIGH